MNLSTLENHLALEFYDAYWERGTSYLRQGKIVESRVSRSTSEHIEIQAKVRGTGQTAYEQQITVVMSEDNDLEVVGNCSCPVGFNCKHVAAVLQDQLNNIGVWLGTDDLSPPTPAPRTLAHLFGVAPASAQKAPSRATTPPHASPLPFNLEYWIKDLSETAQEHGALPVAETGTAVQGKDYVALFVLRASQGHAPVVSLMRSRRLKTGGVSKSTKRIALNDIHYSYSHHLSAEDEDLGRCLYALKTTSYSNEDQVSFRGEFGQQALQRLLATRRCHWHGDLEHPLDAGPVRAVKVEWQSNAQQEWETVPVVQDDHGGWHAAILFSQDPLMYYLPPRHQIGVAEPLMPVAVIQKLLRAPTVPASHARHFSERIAELPVPVDIPTPLTIEVRQHPPAEPAAVLTLHNAAHGLPEHVTLDFAYPLDVLRHAGMPPATLRTRDAQGSVDILPDLDSEEAMIRRLEEYELVLLGHPGQLPLRWTFDEDAEWLEFVRHGVDELRQEGWRVVCPDDFLYDVAEIDDWYGDVEEEGSDWFSLDLGIRVEGRRISLIPVLVGLLRRDPAAFEPEALAQRADDEPVLVKLDDGTRLALPFGRIRSILQVLQELYFRHPDSDGLRLSTLDAARLAELGDVVRLGGQAVSRLQKLAERLRDFSGIRPITLPAGLQATLRPYQHEGLNWLQFLREFELAGILADDMGLGKTLQTLAHILTEKEQGRATHPTLVVAPTSLMGNWRREAARFTPSLQVLVLQGKNRAERFASIAAADVVLTTYPLLSRDGDILREQPWHLLILDEAQNIKNARSQAASVVSQLQANHRLCLTGTPLENHLGELWSLFHFLMPGFLGDEGRFRKDYRNPIEKRGDQERRRFLARRVKPFILRRTKDVVAAELPPKSEIIRSIDLEGGQRDLYETIRASMDQRVRQEISQRGLGRSHILILEALLKLRQICCDPRLLKLTGASKVNDSAKLDHLLELVPELIEEGRRILLFSQFTSMLELIAQAFDRLGIAYVTLTGDTVDRDTPVLRFQNGEVPLFLISLKAGGVGLNLTAADTVIHYDPWWNPAVENQATDRAHRLGQDKPVFVYKLVTSGTVEEKILQLQSRKAALADGILDGSTDSTTLLDQDDLNALFAPLPE